ncbi:hypothetical protein D3C76_1508730 [compost metagenome]
MAADRFQVAAVPPALRLAADPRQSLCSGGFQAVGIEGNAQVSLTSGVNATAAS